MRDSNKPDDPFTADEVMGVIIEAALTWRKQVKTGQGTGRLSETMTRKEWLDHFADWFATREGLFENEET